MRSSFVAFAFVLLIGAITPAQLVIGDLGVCGFTSGNTQFTVLHADGTSSVYGSLAFGATTHAILYDPSQPNTFLVGGTGFLGRIAVTGATTATYTPITTGIGTVTQMAFDGAQLVIGDSGIDQVVRVDPSNGAITPVTSGGQPWGAELNASCFDPNTGDIYVGGLNAIWRIPSGTSTPVAFASGWGASSYVSGLAIDPVSLQVVATLLQVNRFVRISPGGTLTNITPSGPSGCNAVDIDQNGDFIVAAAFGNTYRVPNAGGTAVLIGVASGMIGAATGVSTVIDEFRLNAASSGGGDVGLLLAGIPPGTLEGFTVASFDVSLPVGAGPIFGFNPDALSFALVAGSPTASPGNPVHWTWPVSIPFYPAVPFLTGPGILPPGIQIDLIAVAINSGAFLRPTPVVRLTIN
jgi:hypothetical protein